jgi:hypothetical protein
MVLIATDDNLLPSLRIGGRAVESEVEDVPETIRWCAWGGGQLNAQHFERFHVIGPHPPIPQYAT